MLDTPRLLSIWLASRVCSQLQPRVIVPMHYRTETFGYPKIGTLDAYTKLCDDIVVYGGNTLVLPEDGAPQTAVLRFES